MQKLTVSFMIFIYFFIELNKEFLKIKKQTTRAANLFNSIYLKKK